MNYSEFIKTAGLAPSWFSKLRFWDRRGKAEQARPSNVKDYTGTPYDQHKAGKPVVNPRTYNMDAGPYSRDYYIAGFGKENPVPSNMTRTQTSLYRQGIADGKCRSLREAGPLTQIYGNLIGD